MGFLPSGLTITIGIEELQRAFYDACELKEVDLVTLLPAPKWSVGATFHRAPTVEAASERSAALHHARADQRNSRKFYFP